MELPKKLNASKVLIYQQLMDQNVEAGCFVTAVRSLLPFFHGP